MPKVESFKLPAIRPLATNRSSFENGVQPSTFNTKTELKDQKDAKYKKHCSRFDIERPIELEYAKQGSLYQLLKRQRWFSEKTVAKCVSDLTKALIYCHSYDVIHGDIKPENLQGTIRSSNYVALGILCTLRHHIAPPFLEQYNMYLLELLKASMKVMQLTFGVLGVLCYELLVGVTLFYAKDDPVYSVYNKIRNLIITYPVFISEKAKDLIGKLLVINYEKRLPLTKVLQHPWILENAPEGVFHPVFMDENV